MTPSRSTPRRRDAFLLAGVALTALAAVALLVYAVTAPRRAVLHVAPAERSELFARTLAEAKAMCARQEAVFEDECRRQLELLVEFPECDAECQRFARANLHRPAR